MEQCGVCGGWRAGNRCEMPCLRGSHKLVREARKAGTLFPADGCPACYVAQRPCEEHSALVIR
jgi:hypothetical protein